MRALFSILFFSISIGAMACGTLESRYSFYMKGETDIARFTQLKFLICEPIVSKFKSTEAEEQMLIALIEDAQNRSIDLAKIKGRPDAEWKSEYYRDLAFRIAIRFGVYNWIANEKSMIISRFNSLYQLSGGKVESALSNSNGNSWLSTDKGLDLSDRAYATKLNYEIIELFIGD